MMRKAASRIIIVLLVLLCVAGQGKGVTAGAYGGMSMIVIEGSTNRVLYSSNAHVSRPIASTTKILTAITVIENTDINRTVKVPKAAVGVEGSSIYLGADEPVIIRDLLYGLMLQSGNDCAAALAITVSGGIKEFAALMNETAKKAGAKDANFVNPHGLHDDKHLCSAYDLALISSYAMKNDEFRTIVGTKLYGGMPWAGRDYNRKIHNKNKILRTFEGGNGIKTGFTKKAGRCLVSSAKRGDMEVIAVVLNCGPMFEECSRLMQKAFNEYEMAVLCDVNTKVGECAVTRSDTPTVELFTKSRVAYPLTAAEKERITSTIEPLEFCAPIEAGVTIGKLTYTLDGKELGSSEVFSGVNIYSNDLAAKLHEIIRDWNT